MDYRGVLLVGMLSGAVIVGATTSCSGPDPGQITFSERPKGGIEPSGGSSGVTPEGGTTVDGGPLPEGGAADGGSSGTAKNAFTGAPAYVAGAAAGSSLVAASHANNGGNPAGEDCLSCHGPAGGATNKWGIAGTVYNNKAGMTPIDKAEVRVVDATGKELAKVYTDVRGNFWSPPIAGGIPGGSMSGARNAAITKVMSTALGTTDASCQKGGCHVPANEGRIFLQ